ncbi:MAG: AAA family ATPase [Bacteroidetes bacterium]|nr:AAA family ATPase [Bacteroidota bacterium]MCA6441869.1 AAA family ATPase [Bacteroidota bacterium]
MTNLEINEKFEEVLNFINHTNECVFLTGNAGTGKTTLLKYIKSKTHKRMAIIAPTGVAAINAGGTTIHSFFQFNFTTFLPKIKSNGEVDYLSSFTQNFNFRAGKLGIIKNLELLVIDEVSMVRADMLDQIDIALRNIRKIFDLPFGGVQVLLIGDMYQLPPVIKSDEMALLSTVYNAFYFFNSKVIEKHFPVFVELTKIYRQKDERFVDLLNAVRLNIITEQQLEMLNQRFDPQLTKSDYENNITLTTHNAKADKINTEALQSISGKEYCFEAKVKGSFNENAYPVEETLWLKVGSKVMFLKNNNEKNYYNGKIGFVTKLTDEFVFVKCEEDYQEIKVERETWSNVNYALNEQTKNIEENVLGSFIQFPLRLAWAVTVHKSQGLSFEKVIVDVGESFSAGQVYVALSRCRSLEGLKLSSKISRSVLFNDERIIHFSNRKTSDGDLHIKFKSAQQTYYTQVLLNTFNPHQLKSGLTELKSLIYFHKKHLNSGSSEWTEEYSADLAKEIDFIEKFRSQLQALILKEPDMFATNLTERLKKAAVYFEVAFQRLMTKLVSNPILTESVESAEEINTLLNELYDLLFEKQAYIKSFSDGFNYPAIIKVKQHLKFPEKRLSIYALKKSAKVEGDVKHRDLYQQLSNLRNLICVENKLPIYRVLSNKSLKELSELLPSNKEELLKINGFGKVKVEMFGSEFLELINAYRDTNGIHQELNFTKSTKKSKPDKLKEVKEKALDKTTKISTYETTYKLIEAGMGLSEIASVRKMAISTVEGHVAVLIKQGLLDVRRVLPQETIVALTKIIQDNPELKTLNELKAVAPEKYTFSELRMVLNFLQSN